MEPTFGDVTRHFFLGFSVLYAGFVLLVTVAEYWRHIELKFATVTLLFALAVAGHAIAAGGLGFWRALVYVAGALLLACSVYAALTLAIVALVDRIRGA
jgi:hypothetical protein